MKVDFDEKDIVGILKSYFAKEKNVDCDVTINYSEIDYECVVSFRIDGYFKVLGNDYYTNIELDEKEVYEIFENIFVNEGYEVRNVLFNKGIDDDNEVYFNGVTLLLAKTKNRTKSIGKRK